MPVHYCTHSQFGRYWSISGYNDIVEIESQPQLFSSEAQHGGICRSDMVFTAASAHAWQRCNGRFYFSEMIEQNIRVMAAGPVEREAHPFLSGIKSLFVTISRA